MKKIIYSVLFSSLLIATAAHAEENIKPTMMMDGKMMTGSGTPGGIPPEWRRDGMMGSGTPKFSDRPMMVFSSSSMPMMGTSSMGCRKFTRALSFGIRGEDVKELQEMLHERGYLNASSTGYFGRMTKEAVVKFQKEGGLNPSGYFGELSRKQHEKRCGEGMGKAKDDDNDDKAPWMGSSTLPRPCMTNATTTGCEHSNAFVPCFTKFSPTTGLPCQKPPKDDDDRTGSSTCKGDDCRPSGIFCTMEARMCADGSMMPRDNMCGWHPEKCAVPASTTPTI